MQQRISINVVLFKRRFETLEPEMNTLGARITDVNQVAQQLLGSDNRNKEQINQTQDQLNNRYSHTLTSTKSRLNTAGAIAHARTQTKPQQRRD